MCVCVYEGVIVIDKLRRSTRVVGAVSSWSELLHGRLPQARR